MADEAILADGLVKRFGDLTAVDGIDLRVPRGEIFAVLGPNGAGKTTLMRMLATLDRPDGGRASVMGHDLIAAPDAVRSAIAMTGQFASLDEDLTGRENLILLARLWGFRGRAARDRADALLSDFDLSDAATRQVKDYSGGMRRRLDIAASLIVTPGVLFLDEPTTGLDPIARAALWDALDRRRARDGSAQVVATHLMDEAERADLVAILHRGRLVRLGTPAALRAEVGATALWLDADDASTLARTLTEADGLDARPVGDRVLVRTDRPEALVGVLFGRADVRAASVQEATMEDVFRIAITDQ